MPELLGSLLLRKELIAKEQLDAALAAQARHGGRLGTNLVECGELTLGALGAALAEQRGAALATKDELDAANAHMLMSKRVAKDYLAVPLRVENRALVVAMASAWDEAAVDALERELRTRVQARLAPELVVLAYLERIYGLKAARPVPVQGHPFSGLSTAGATPFAAGSELGEPGDDGFFEAMSKARPLGPAPANKGPQGHIESRLDALLHGEGEPAEPAEDDLPILQGTVLEGPPPGPPVLGRIKK